MKRTFIVLNTLLLTVGLNAQTFEWAQSLGANSTDHGRSIAVDASGNVYTAGNFRGTADFDPGAGEMQLTSAGLDDIFVQKVDASGNFLWAKSFGGSLSDYGQSIALDPSGNVHITGYYRGTADFDPGAGEMNLTSEGLDDIFIQKLDASGDFLWAKSFGSGEVDYGRSITVDASGNVYTTGEFRGTVDFDPGAGSTDIATTGFDDVFIQKLDASGEFVWARTFGGPSVDFGRSITVDDSGNIYTTGYFFGTSDFDPGAGELNLSSEGYDVFVQKLDASGDLLWAKSFGGGSDDYGQSIRVDASGNVHTTGYFQDTADLDPGAGETNFTSMGGEDIFIQKLDAAGDFLWANSFGGNLDDVGQSIAVDASDNVYSTGYFLDTVDFDPGAGETNLSSAGGRDVFVHKVDSDGNLLWARTCGGGSDDYGRSITVDAVGNVYSAGEFSSSGDFDPGAGTNTLTSAGGNDVFVLKLNDIGVGILENDFGNSLSIFPNPSAGNFTIDLGASYERVQIMISDISGKVIRSQTITQAHLYELSIDAPAGIYIVSIQAEDRTAVMKLIKE